MRFYDVLDAEIDYREQYLQENFAAGVANYEYYHTVYEAEMAAIEAYDTNHDKALLEAEFSVILEGWISKAWDKVKEWCKKAWKAIKSFFKWIKKNILKAWNWLKKKFKSITESATSIYEKSTVVQNFTFDYDINRFIKNVEKFIKFKGPEPNQLLSIIKSTDSNEELKEKVISLPLNALGIKYSSNLSDVSEDVRKGIYEGTEKSSEYEENELDRIQKTFMKLLGNLEDDIDDAEKSLKNYEKMIDMMQDHLKSTTDLSDQKISFMIHATKSIMEYAVQIDKVIASEMNKMFMRMVRQFAKQAD